MYRTYREFYNTFTELKNATEVSTELTPSHVHAVIMENAVLHLSSSSDEIMR